MRYLDPKNDLTFKKVFGEHPHLLISFLNAMLPLEGREIESIEYLSPEMIPELPGMKHSIVDVRCTEKITGRQFFVEMQMYWTNAFKQRMLFNASKAYVQQVKKGQQYNSLQPVYGLSLVNEDFETEKEFELTFYHHYKMVHVENQQKNIDGLELVFIELPKFQTQNFTERKLRYLWLKYLTLISEGTKDIPQELQENAEISEAISYLQISSFSEEELAYYDKYWDSVRIEKTALEEKFAKGKTDEKHETAFRGFEKGYSDEIISDLNGLTTSEVKILRQEWEKQK